MYLGLSWSGPGDHRVAKEGEPRGAGVSAVSTEGRLPRYHSLDPFIPFWLEGSGNHFISALNLEIWGNKLKTAQLFVPSAR